VNGRVSYLAIVNPAAGGGRSRKMLGSALERLRAGGVTVDVAETQGPGDATRLARDAYGRGRRRFIAVGGDGTSYEVVNGLFPEASAGERPKLGFLPLGTGNSFLRDFSRRGELAGAAFQRPGRVGLRPFDFSWAGAVAEAAVSGAGERRNGI